MWMSSQVLAASDITATVFTEAAASDVAVSVRGLSKSYSIAKNAVQHSTMGEALMHKLKNPLTKAERETFWALSDVNFDIQKGDVVGIIGRNGAGKSTLLKILSRITEPTRGKIDLYGRVGSLLEVGTGFHPELTGRENVYLNGAILGMKRSEIARQFDAIVEFSGTEQFLDTPVKRYSSGMYVRLAFAVAAHLNPEILIVDEVLAVGDGEFQKKCLGKMQDVAASGRTVLFVSHNLDVVRKLCTNAILMQKGRVLLSSSTKAVLERYMESGMEQQSFYAIAPPTEGTPLGYGESLSVEDLDGVSVNEIAVGHPWQVKVRFTLTARTTDFIIALGILTPLDVPLRTSWSQPSTLEPGTYEAVFRDAHIMLEPGRYPLTVGLSSQGRTFHFAEKTGMLHISDVTDLSDDSTVVKVTDCGFILNPMEVTVGRRF